MGLSAGDTSGRKVNKNAISVLAGSAKIHPSKYDLANYAPEKS